MTTAFHAIYENGVFRPIQPVDIPDRCEVEVEIRTVRPTSGDESQETFTEETITVLSARDRDRFLELIDNPPPPNAALRSAISDYRKQYG
jgi:predicted DNA-binding antitoxin AbrB/MazE fold protein